MEQITPPAEKDDKGIPSPGSFQIVETQRRNRPTLSCTLCRQAKLKCNRERPACDQCIKRSREEQCYYAPPPAKRQPQDTRKRVKQLERLVVNLINNRNIDTDANKPNENPGQDGETTRQRLEWNSGLAKYADSVAATEALGKMNISNSNHDNPYGTSAHWAAILKDIEEVKDHLDEYDEDIRQIPEPEDLDEQPADTYAIPDVSMTLMLGPTASLSKADILAQLPDKATCDQHVATFLGSYDPFQHIIHGPTFMKEYEEFWIAPRKASLMFIALLFAVIALGAFFQSRMDYPQAFLPTSTVIETTARLRSLCANALVLGDYTAGKEHTVEALLLYMATQHHLQRDADTRIWVLMGLIVRVALRNSMHRDPSHFPNVTPYQGEMRRRTWHMLMQLEVLISFQQGLPSMTMFLQSDVQPPRNLADSDFGSDSKELPQARPLPELTPVSYAIAKRRICSIFAKAAEMSHAQAPIAYNDIMDLDARLRDAHDLIPPALKMRKWDQHDREPFMTMLRVNLELLYQRTRCVLHRKFLTKRQTDERHAYSRKTCLGAAIATLEQHEAIYEATIPGRQLDHFRWYMSSLTSHNFLLASMILCLQLSYIRNADPQTAQRMIEEVSWDHDKVVGLLQSSHVIWKKHKTVSREAALASRITGEMLKKVNALPQQPTPQLANVTTVSPPTNGLTPSMSVSSTETTDVSMDLSSWTPNQANPMMDAADAMYTFDDPNFAASMQDPAPIDSMLDFNSADVDWNIWDSRLTSHYVEPSMNLNGQSTGGRFMFPEQVVFNSM